MEERIIIEYAHEMRTNDPGMGYGKIWYKFNRNGSDIRIGRDRFLLILHENGFKLRGKVRSPRTTNSRHGYALYPNLARELLMTRPNQLWVSDITYITIWRSADDYFFCYLSVIMDDCHKEIVGYAVHETLDTAGCLKALEMALKKTAHERTQKLIHHSDRGTQYASSAYVTKLKANGIEVSMTENSDPKENAASERVNNTIKNELLRGERFTSVRQVRETLARRIRFYNEERPHMSLNMCTPLECRNMTGVIYKKWDRKQEKYLKPENGQVIQPASKTNDLSLQCQEKG